VRGCGPLGGVVHGGGGGGGVGGDIDRGPEGVEVRPQGRGVWESRGREGGRGAADGGTNASFCSKTLKTGRKIGHWRFLGAQKNRKLLTIKKYVRMVFRIVTEATRSSCGTPPRDRTGPSPGRHGAGQAGRDLRVAQRLDHRGGGAEVGGLGD